MDCVAGHGVRGGCRVREERIPKGLESQGKCLGCIMIPSGATGEKEGK